MNGVQKGIAIVVTSIGLAGAALGAPAQAAASTGEGLRWASFGSHDAKSAERLAKRQAALHDKLSLAPAQEAAWKSFTDRLQASAPVRSEPRSGANMTAPERADRMVAFLQTAEQRAVTRAQAIKEFYSVLSPEQQKIFDHEFHGRHHGRDRG